MPPKTVRVKPVKNANASAGGGKAAAASAAGKGGKSAKSAAAPVAGKKTASAAAPKTNMVREVKPMTPVTPRVKDEKEEEETEEPPSYVQHENMMYNEYDLDGRRILSPEPTSRWGRYWKRARMRTAPQRSTGRSGNSSSGGGTTEKRKGNDILH